MAKKSSYPDHRHAQASRGSSVRRARIVEEGAEAILNDLVGRITKHLKRASASASSASASCRCASAPPAWAATPPPAKAIHIKASKKVAFRAAKELKEAV